ncbi:MAG: dUTP diphosphatase [Clostridia bacterium]|nr:dUTP diphosphatase [Clostridia bacterium]
MEKINVKFKRLAVGAKFPEYQTSGAAAVDLSSASADDIVIPKGEIRSVPTGLALEIPEGVVAVVSARSGLAFRNGISLANGIGVIDSDYRGEIRVGLLNAGGCDFTVHSGDRIAQMMFLPVLAAEIEAADELSETERGEGGFGSTGIK